MKGDRFVKVDFWIANNIANIYLLGNYPRDLQGGNKLACGAGSQKPETEKKFQARE